MKRLFVGAAVACAFFSVSSQAKDLKVVPISGDNQTIRFEQGVPTVDMEMSAGAVQISPLPMDHGKLSFSIIYWNRGNSPVNFGVESLAATFDDKPVPVLTVDELIKRAKSRAMWGQIGIAVLAGAAAAASANTTDHYRMTTVGPRGRTYSTFGSFTRSNPEAVATYTAAGAAGVYLVQQRLDATRKALGDNIIQTTTVDPDDSYGGAVVLEKVRLTKREGVVVLRASLGEESYDFRFTVTK